VQDGVLFAELNEMLMHELAEDGYSGVEIRRTPMRTEIIIRATRTREVLGEKGQRIRELTSCVQKRFGFPEGTVEMFAERVHNRGLSAMAQAESLKFKLIGGLQVRRACYGVIRFVMESGALGVEVMVSGKARVQRAKTMKFKSGFLITTGRPAQVLATRTLAPCFTSLSPSLSHFTSETTWSLPHLASLSISLTSIDLRKPTSQPHGPEILLIRIQPGAPRDTHHSSPSGVSVRVELDVRLIFCVVF
jgi:ribosomal protein uS3